MLALLTSVPRWVIEGFSALALLTLGPDHALLCRALLCSVGH